MLTITVPPAEFYDEISASFVTSREETLTLEHSLVSVSKWESKWCKPFLWKTEKTVMEITDYIRCMTVSQNHSPDIYLRMPGEIIKQITEYINAPMTATWFNEADKTRPGRDVVTSEVIYYWMFSLNIPMECQKWHLNRLLTLIKVCNIKSAPPKKMGRGARMSQQRALNEARRRQFNTRG